MAYLSPTKLTCPTCGLSARVELVVGVGPGSRKGDLPYRQYREEGPFVASETASGLGQLLCPEDGTVVWTNQRAAQALGPLTEREMRGITGERWLVPGTPNPFPREPLGFDPNDPFSAPPRTRPGGAG